MVVKGPFCATLNMWCYYRTVVKLVIIRRNFNVIADHALVGYVTKTFWRRYIGSAVRVLLHSQFMYQITNALISRHGKEALPRLTFGVMISLNRPLSTEADGKEAWDRTKDGAVNLLGKIVLSSAS